MFVFLLCIDLAEMSVLTFSFRFFDGDGREDAVNWLTGWDGRVPNRWMNGWMDDEKL